MAGVIAIADVVGCMVLWLLSMIASVVVVVVVIDLDIADAGPVSASCQRTLARFHCARKRAATARGHQLAENDVQRGSARVEWGRSRERRCMLIGKGIY